MDMAYNKLSQSELEALAMLFLKNQDLSAYSPSELLNKYREVYKELHATNEKPKAKLI